jgi:hypothetical protein
MTMLEQRENQAQRYLEAAYDASDGGRVWPDYREVGTATGLSADETDRVTDYLQECGLISFPAMGHVKLESLGKWTVESRRPAN